MFTLNCKGRLLVADKPLVMGIINATPDSFYAGSRQNTVDGILQQAEAMLTAGSRYLGYWRSKFQTGKYVSRRR